MKKMKFYDYGAFFFSLVNISQFEPFDAFQELFSLFLTWQEWYRQQNDCAKNWLEDQSSK